MKQIYYNLLRTILAVSDLMLINICLLLCRYLSVVEIQVNVIDFIVSVLIWLSSSHLFNLYGTYTIRKQSTIFRSTWRTLVCYLCIFSVYLLFSDWQFNLNVYLIFFTSITLVLLVSRLLHPITGYFTKRIADQDPAVRVLAIASIGGHWVQLLRLMPLFKSNNVTFISTKSSLKDTVDGFKYYAVPDANRRTKFELVKCCMSILYVILVLKPNIIITTGAAPGLFAIAIGRIFGIKTVWIDSIANVEKLSLSGKIAIKVADRVYTQWEHLSTPRIVFAGNIL